MDLSNIIIAEISVGELIDKITILEIKLEKISDDEKVKHINRELSSLVKTRDDAKLVNGELVHLASELKKVNENLWSIEDQIRDHEKSNNFGITFVDLARRVYKANDERSLIKRKINEYTGSAIVEEKSYSDY